MSDRGDGTFFVAPMEESKSLEEKMRACFSHSLAHPGQWVASAVDNRVAPVGPESLKKVESRLNDGLGLVKAELDAKIMRSNDARGALEHQVGLVEDKVGAVHRALRFETNVVNGQISAFQAQINTQKVAYEAEIKSRDEQIKSREEQIRALQRDVNDQRNRCEDAHRLLCEFKTRVPTKEDLEARSADYDTQLKAQSAAFDAQIKAQSAAFEAQLKARDDQISALQRAFNDQRNRCEEANARQVNSGKSVEDRDDNAGSLMTPSPTGHMVPTAMRASTVCKRKREELELQQSVSSQKVTTAKKSSKKLEVPSRSPTLSLSSVRGQATTAPKTLSTTADDLKIWAAGPAAFYKASQVCTRKPKYLDQKVVFVCKFCPKCLRGLDRAMSVSWDAPEGVTPGWADYNVPPPPDRKHAWKEIRNHFSEVENEGFDVEYPNWFTKM